MSRQSWLGIIATFAVAIALLVYLRPISEFFAGLFISAPQTTAAAQANSVVGELIERNGSVAIHAHGNSQFVSARPPFQIHHLDQMKVDIGSSAKIKFTSGWMITIHENSLATFEQYRPQQANSPVLLSFAHGSPQVSETGPAGSLFVMLDHKVTTPDKVAVNPSRTVEINNTAAQVPAASAPSLKNTKPVPLPATAPVVTPTTLPAGKNKTSMRGPEKMPTSEHTDTLTSSYIEEILGTQAPFLRRCQLNSVRDNQSAEGSLVLTLTIGADGRVDHIRVLQDQTKNKQLSSCAVSVLERTQFKSFADSPITLNYPIEFK